MKIFHEDISPVYTKSDLNVLKVESFEEIFYDVFEVQINGNKYPLEKISEYKGSPVVSVPVLVEDQEVFFPFVLVKGKQEIIFNENNTLDTLSLDGDVDLIKEKIIVPVVEETKEVVIIEQTPTIQYQNDKRSEILEEIAQSKKEALEYANFVKDEKIKEANKVIKKDNKILEKTLEDARSGLVEDFLNISKKIKEDLFDFSNDSESKLSEKIDNRISIISEDLKRSLSNDFDESSKHFDKNVKEVIKELYQSIVIPKVNSELKSISTDIVETFSEIETELYNKLDETLASKADKTLIESINEEVQNIQKLNVELNDNINKGLSKALSRVGKVSKEFEIFSEEIDRKIDQSAQEISDYYNQRVQFLETQALDLNDKTRQYFIGLIEESRDSLIEEIRKTKEQSPIEYIVEAMGKKDPEIVSIDKLKKEYDKIIHDKFENYKVDLRKYITVYGGGGGSVAMQFADGGTMNGNLTIVGAISASQYLGIPASSGGAYLPLSGGVITGSVSALNLSADNITTRNVFSTTGSSQIWSYGPSAADPYSYQIRLNGASLVSLNNGGNFQAFSFSVGGQLFASGSFNNIALAGRTLTLSDTIAVGGMSLTGALSTNTLALTPTWNTTGGPTLIYGRVNNIASSLSSNLIDVGTLSGGSLFRVGRAGNVNINDTTIGGYTVPSLGFNGVNTGFSAIAGYGMAMMVGGLQAVQMDSRGGTNPLFAVTGVFGASTVSVGGTYGTHNGATLANDAVHILAQRNGTNSQTSRLYNTFTARGAGTTNLEALETKAQAGGSFIIQSLKGSNGGAARNIEFRHGATDTNGSITNGTLIATVTSSGLTVTNLSITGDSAYGAATTFTYDPTAAATHRTALGVAKTVEVFDFTRTTAPAGATGGSGTWAWNLPTGAKTMKIFTVGAGGGGGSGKKDATLTARYGGGGGSGGGTTIIELPVGTFTSLSIAVGLGGTGGVSQTVTASNGNFGGSGGNSTVSVTVSSNTFSICQGGGGNGGAGGSATSGNGGVAPAFSMWASGGGAGGLGTVGGDGAMPNAYPISLGGAGGGGVSTLNAFGNGNRGSINSTFLATTFGATQTIEGGNGTQGAVINAAAIYGYSGGGGGAGSSVGTGGNGANGTGYGAGGGGGGGSLGNSGAGGNGGDGFVRIMVFY